MATSERVLTTIGSAADVQRGTVSSYFIPHRPVWGQAVLDLLAIAAGLSLVPAAVPAMFKAAALPVAPAVLAVMMSTILGFAGAYPKRRTPLDIGDSAGLLRGICCAGVLLLMGSAATRSTPSVVGLTGAFLTIGFLVAERELVQIVRQRKRSTSLSPLAETTIASQLGGRASVTHLEYDWGCETPYQQDAAAFLVKRAIDIAGAATMLFLALPLLTCVALLIKLDSPGPVLIRQRRIGRRGVPFYMWKFRSMYNEVARYERSPISDADPRLTRVGRALRRFSVDELPQLLNVLHGEMSLVGPRPEMPFIVKRYKARERFRLNALPGITGLWQISPARAEPIHYNLELDLFYIANQNVFLDAAILLRTVTAVFRGIGAT